MITAFLPCRKGSERVKNKNTKKFSKHEFGLIELKINQLLSSKNIDNIFLSTNDQTILDYVNSLRNEKIILHKRDDNLASSTTSTDELVGHILDYINTEHVLWTHVTSPFVDSLLYDNIIEKYLDNLESSKYDSLMTVNTIHGFIWNEDGPINYNRTIEKWPRTQTIPALYEINSAVFLNSLENYKQYNDRIGKSPYLYQLDKIEGFDIDWNDDFEIAEIIYENRQ